MIKSNLVRPLPPSKRDFDKNFDDEDEEPVTIHKQSEPLLVIPYGEQPALLWSL